MSDIVERRSAAKRKIILVAKQCNIAQEHDILRAVDELSESYSDEIATLRAKLAEAEKALVPFASAGAVIDGPFGPALFPDDATAFSSSGCHWTENDEHKRITWGDFRAARSALAAIKGGA